MSALLGTWRSIWRFHRLLAGILVLEYALAFAIILTAANVLVSRASAILQASGVNERGLYALQGRGFNQPVHRFQIFDARSRFASLVGRNHVAIGSSMPFLGYFGHVMTVSVPNTKPSAPSMQINAYNGGLRFASVAGLRLLHGRWFHKNDIVHRYGETTHLVILSQSLARHLFHGEMALGREVKISGQMHTVIGVINPLAAPDYLGSQRTTWTMLLPRIGSSRNLLLIRYDGPATDLQRVLADLRKHDAGKVRWALTPYSAIRAQYFRSDRATVAALAGVVLAVFLTALCGILGLTNYWVARRRPQIAIRRALGAKKSDINRHFLVESGLLATTGLLLGFVLKLVMDVFFTRLHMQGGLSMWVAAIALVLVLVILVVFASLRRWQRMSPTELMRQTHG